MRNIVSPLDGIRSPFGRRLGNVFSPLSLFASNEPGGWYDPSDLTTMFQDAAGTTAAALEQPVGLVLDKSKGLALGSEAIPNWASSGFWSIYNVGVVFNGTTMAFDAINDRCAAPTPLTSGKTYKATVTASITGGAAFSIDDDGTAGGPGSTTTYLNNATGTTTFYIRATASTRLRISQVASGSVTITGLTMVEIAGNHLSQSTSTARPVLSARVNLLVQTEDFLAAGWTKIAGTETINADNATAPNGTTTAERVTRSGTTWWHGVRRNVTVSTNTVYTLSLFVKAGTGDPGIVVAAGSTVDFGVKLNNGVPAVISDGGTSPVISYEAEPAGNGWYRLYASFNSSTATTIGVGTADGSAVNNAYNWYWGADLRPANAGVGLPAYQRVGAATSGTSSTGGTADYDVSGFPYYLKFDGTDDSLSSASIDFTSTDKMSVFAGVRKLSDVTQSMLVELSAAVASNNGSYNLQAPRSTTNGRYAFIPKGTVSAPVDADDNAYLSPNTSVVTGIASISEDIARLRINGVQANENTSDQGTGNFGNYALYVGSRNSASLRFNGHLYSLIIRGAATDAATISSTETWVNGKTNAYGPPVEILTRDGSTILTRDGSTVIGRAN